MFRVADTVKCQLSESTTRWVHFVQFPLGKKKKGEKIFMIKTWGHLNYRFQAIPLQIYPPTKGPYSYSPSTALTSSSRQGSEDSIQNLTNMASYVVGSPSAKLCQMLLSERMVLRIYFQQSKRQIQQTHTINLTVCLGTGLRTCQGKPDYKANQGIWDFKQLNKIF